MESANYPPISLHDVAETIPAEWPADGDQLCRLPATVRSGLNVSARERVRHPTGSEIRFIPEHDEGEVKLTLSAADRTRIRPF